MKLNFKDETLSKFSFLDLEYGLQMLILKRNHLRLKVYEYVRGSMRDKKFGTIGSVRDIRKLFTDEIDTLEKRIALVEDELGNRLLTGNDDGMLDREVLGG
jgi:hypothetical protein